MASPFYSSLIGFVTGFATSLIGWQLNLVAMHRGLERGRHAAFFTGVGAIAADIIFISIAFTGLSPFVHHPEWWHHLKWVSIVMLLFVAARTYFRRRSISTEKAQKKRNPAKSFLFGFLLIGTNPLFLAVWIGIVSFLVSHFPDARILHYRVIFLISFLIGGTLWFLILAQYILHHARQWEEERLHLLSRIFSIALVIGAIGLMWAKF